jgi:hypothetical protein
MRHLFTVAVLGLAFAVGTTAVAEPLAPAPVAKKKKKKCFKKKHGKRVRVKCKKPKKKPATQTPTNQTPTTETPTTAPGTTPTSPSDTTGQAAIDQMTNELKGGRWRYFTSGYETSTSYTLNLCADGTFLRVAESVGVQTFRYGTWKVTEAVIFGDGSGRGARVQGPTLQSDPPDADDLDLTLAVRNSDNQWFWGENAAQYFPGAAVCTG